VHPLIKIFWDAIPQCLQDLIAMTVDRLAGQEVPPPPTAGDTPVRLFIAPANYAGQGYRWARAVEANPAISARNMVYAEINPFDYPADYQVRWRTVTHSRAWQSAQFEALTSAFTHVLVEAEFPPLGGMFSEDVRGQVRLLTSAGTSVAMVCHGSDIRLPSRHRLLEQWSPFANDDWVNVAEVEAATAANRRLLDDLALPTFVSTPGLLLDVPYGHLLPVVIDAEPWATAAPVLERQRPRVLHVPSNSLVKGTAQIEPTMLKMHEEGVIEYIRAEGLAHDQMPTLYASADIVLDQFRLGDYGAGACEAMAGGRLVLSHVSAQARHAVAEAGGLRLPILEADIDSLENVLRDLVRNPAPYRALAVDGPAFVDRVHGGALSRSILERHFLTPEAPTSAR
jgi:hypothetical protein